MLNTVEHTIYNTNRKMAKTVTKKTTAKPASTPEPAPSKPVVEEGTTTPTEEVADTKPKEVVDSNPANVYQTKLNAYFERVNVMSKEMKELVALGRTLDKEYQQIMKAMSKKSKYVKSNEERPLSGFAMPSLLSNELYDFLNLEKGSKVPRKDVTRMMNDYIKKNELRDEKDKRTIKPNKELHKIFNSTDNDKITYFNLQAFMKHHFIKDNAATAKVGA